MAFYVPTTGCGIRSINTAFIRDAQENFYFGGEMHNFWEMVYVQEGSATVSEDERIYELTEGQLVFHKPMEFHRLWCRKGQSGKLCIISFHYDGSIIDVLGKGVFLLNLSLQQMLKDSFSQIVSNFHMKSTRIQAPSVSTLEERSTFLKFELLLLSIASELSPDKQQEYTIGARNYKMILNVMKEHIHENLNIDDIAALSCLSTSNLKKTFKTYAGCGVMQHFNRLRIIRAEELLKEGYSVAEVSNSMSFSSPSYFTTVFKRETGYPPTHFRKMR